MITIEIRLTDTGKQVKIDYRMTAGKTVTQMEDRHSQVLKALIDLSCEPIKVEALLKELDKLNKRQ